MIDEGWSTTPNWPGLRFGAAGTARRTGAAPPRDGLAAFVDGHDQRFRGQHEEGATIVRIGSAMFGPRAVARTGQYRAARGLDFSRKRGDGRGDDQGCCAARWTWPRQITRATRLERQGEQVMPTSACTTDDNTRPQCGRRTWWCCGNKPQMAGSRWPRHGLRQPSALALALAAGVDFEAMTRGLSHAHRAVDPQHAGRWWAWA